MYCEAFNWGQTSLGLTQIFSDDQVDRVKRYLAGTFRDEYDTTNPPTNLWEGKWEGNANYNSMSFT
jgi:hypothetical protein